MVRQHLPMAMQGLAVVPLFAGYDVRRGIGRIYTYDVTGGHYEEADFQATGSGGRDARTTIKLGYREGLTPAEAVELAIEALFEAADEDAGTGGPDLVRGIYPLVAVVDAEGYAQVDEAEVADRFLALIERQRAERGGREPGKRRTVMTHALLRRPRAGDEGPGRVRRRRASPGADHSWPSPMSTAS